MSTTASPTRKRNVTRVGSAAVRRMRAAIWRTGAIARRAAGYRGREASTSKHSPTWLARHWERIILKLLKHGGATTGNAVSLCCDGDDGMVAIWNAIAGATHSVWFEMYTFQPDRVGKRTIEELTNAAKRG